LTLPKLCDILSKEDLPLKMNIWNLLSKFDSSIDLIKLYFDFDFSHSKDLFVLSITMQLPKYLVSLHIYFYNIAI